MDDGDTDEEDVWRCKACGQRQRDPNPPCEHCWNTKLVRGAGAADVAGEGERSTVDRIKEGPGPTAGLLERVQWATSRAGFVSLLATVGFAWLYDVATAGSLVSEIAFTGGVAAAVLTAGFLSATLGTALWRTVGAYVDV